MITVEECVLLLERSGKGWRKPQVSVAGKAAPRPGGGLLGLSGRLGPENGGCTGKSSPGLSVSIGRRQVKDKHVGNRRSAACDEDSRPLGINHQTRKLSINSKYESRNSASNVTSYNCPSARRPRQIVPYLPPVPRSMSQAHISRR